MRISRKLVTPKQARKWLEGQGANRPLSRSITDKFRTDMEAGRWYEDTGETVKISTDGLVLDGQHRLSALASSSLQGGIYMWVATDVDSMAQEFIDIGKPRSVSDVLKLRHPDLTNVVTVAAITRWLVQVPELGEGGVFVNKLKAQPTVHQILDRFEEDPIYIAACATEAHHITSAMPFFPPTVVGYTWYQIDKVDRGAAMEFFRAIRQLSFSMNDDPRKAVFERAQMLYRDPTLSKGSKEHSAMLAAAITRGYNAWAAGEQVKIVRVREAGRLVEPVKPHPRKFDAVPDEEDEG